jgi:hypothetical protein
VEEADHIHSPPANSTTPSPGTAPTRREGTRRGGTGPRQVLALRFIKTRTPVSQDDHHLDEDRRRHNISEGHNIYRQHIRRRTRQAFCMHLRLAITGNNINHSCAICGMSFPETRQRRGKTNIRPESLLELLVCPPSTPHHSGPPQLRTGVIENL